VTKLKDRIGNYLRKTGFAEAILTLKPPDKDIITEKKIVSNETVPIDNHDVIKKVPVLKFNDQ
jgi:hypothetical protein